MDTKILTQFLLDSNQAGYAAGDEKKWVKEKNGSTTIQFSKGDLRSHDNFFGGEPYGGRLVVFQNEKPVWIMVYYGQVVETAVADDVYKILRSALQRMPKDAPFRGPKEFVDGDFKYINSWSGDVEKYNGTEKIMKNGKLIYKASYIGGLVDKRGGV